MIPGKAISPVIHWIVIRLSTIMNEEDITMYTNISTRSVCKISQLSNSLVPSSPHPLEGPSFITNFVMLTWMCAFTDDACKSVLILLSSIRSSA